jgi:hypothetical protein
MPVARPKATNIFGLLSFAGLLLVWVLVLDPFRIGGSVPRGPAIGMLTALSVLSLLASLSGVRAWRVVFVATILSLAFVLFFYHPLVYGLPD